MEYKTIWKNKSNHRMFNEMQKNQKCESQKALVGRRIAQKLRNQSMTIDIHPQSMEEARETSYNCSVRDHKAIRNGC